MNLYLVLGVLLLGFGIVSWRKPLWAVGALLALLPVFQVRFEIIYPTTLLELLLVVFLLVIFANNLKNFERIKPLGKFNWPVLLFLAAGIISVIVSPQTARALGHFKAYIFEPIMFFYALRLMNLKQADCILPIKMLFWSASALALFGVIQFFTLLNLPMKFWGSGDEVRRIVSVFEHPNAFALYLGPLFVFFAALFVKKNFVVGRVWLFLGLVIQALALLLTFSRASWLGVAFALCVLVFSQFSWKKIIPLGLVLICLFFILTPVRERLMLTLHDPSGMARVDLSHAAVEKLKSSPILGNGLFGFRETLQEQNFRGEILNYPHNIILNFWLELGLLGLVSFTWIVASLFKGFKKQPTVYALAASSFLITLLVHGLLDTPYFRNDLAVLFWFIAAILI